MMIMDNYTEVIEYVKEQIDYDYLLKYEKLDTDLLDCVVILIAETYMLEGPDTIIARVKYSTEYVKDRFSQLNSEHIKYIFDCLNSTRTEIRNIRQYLRTALFNAPATMGAYYQRKVHMNKFH